MLSLWVCEGWWFSKASTAYSHLGKRRSILALLQLISMTAIVVTSAFLHRKGSTLTSADSARSSNQCDYGRSVPIFKPQHLIFFPFSTLQAIIKFYKIQANILVIYNLTFKCTKIFFKITAMIFTMTLWWSRRLCQLFQVIGEGCVYYFRYFFLIVIVNSTTKS